ncbi:MAG: hypothetical protein WD988_00150 [Candidatus Curtissbacteria bacterium]
MNGEAQGADHKTDREPLHAWLLDVDSTITDPSLKKVPLQMFKKLEAILLKPEPVALVSGRSISWLEERVTGPFEKFIKDPQILENFYVSSEFGAMSKYYKNGNAHVSYNLPNILPSQLIKQSESITSKYKETMFFDKSKKTMISVEMNDKLALSRFRGPQKLLHKDLQALIKKFNLQDQFEVQSDTIATNIKHKNANKGKAAQEVLEWLVKLDLKPQAFTVIGDSLDDSQIATALGDRNLSVEFIFVGRSADKTKLKLDLPVVFTRRHYWRGTLEYLSSHTLLKTGAIITLGAPLYAYLYRTP